MVHPSVAVWTERDDVGGVIGPVIRNLMSVAGAQVRARNPLRRIRRLSALKRRSRLVLRLLNITLQLTPRVSSENKTD